MVTLGSQLKKEINDTRLKPGSHGIFRIWFHLVLVTKYRRKVITPEIGARIEAITRAIVEKHGGLWAGSNGEADHRHILLDLPPSVQPSRLVCSIKTATSRIVRKEYAGELKRVYWKSILYLVYIYKDL
jgi:putative transposase